jgi:hypothetical protein
LSAFPNFKLVTGLCHHGNRLTLNQGLFCYGPEADLLASLKKINLRFSGEQKLALT